MANNSEKNNTRKSVNLKRTVTIKAIVTDDFKKYLEFELQEGMKIAYTRYKDLEREAQGAQETLRKQNAPQEQIQAIQNQLQFEHQQYQNNSNTLKQRVQQSRDLKNGTFFVQGTIDGYTTVKVGDNLYQKLGGLEIVIKDGIVQDIINLTIPLVPVE